MEDQRIAYAAFYEAFAAASAVEEGGDPEGGWFAGVAWWMWRSDPTSGGLNDQTFTPQGKPAALEMRKFARRQGTLLRLPSAAAAAAPTASPRTPAAAAAPREAAAARQALEQRPLAATLGGPWPQRENGVVVGSGEWTSFEDAAANSSRLDSAAAAQSLAQAHAHGVNSVRPARPRPAAAPWRTRARCAAAR